MADTHTHSQLSAWAVIIYAWAVIAWGSGWMVATAAVAAPMLAILVYGFIRGAIHHVQVKRAVERAIKR